jgi:hypothetical protein
MAFSPTIRHRAHKPFDRIDNSRHLLQLTSMSAIKALFFIGPLLFGLAFLAPLTAQAMDRLGLSAPMGLTALQFGLILGGVLGLIATIRGRWV